MGITKIKLPNGELKWEVRCYKSGRSGGTIRRRFDKKAEAENFETEFEASKKNVVFGAPTLTDQQALKFGTVAEDWIKFNALKFSSSHKSNVEAILKTDLCELKMVPLVHVTAEIVMKIEQSILLKGRTQSTANRVVEVVLAVINFAIKLRKISHNPAIGFRKTKAVTEMLFWSTEEAIEFLKYTDQKYPRGTKSRGTHLVYLLALHSGHRAGELWGTMPKDILLEKSGLMIRRQFHNIDRVLSSTKSDRPRFVPCPKPILLELAEYCREQRIGPDDLVFTNRIGKPIDHSNFIKVYFSCDIAESGVRRIRFHDLRHTAATQMIKCGADIRTVQEVFGHSDIKTTAGYTHTTSDSVTKIAMNYSLVEPKEVKKI